MRGFGSTKDKKLLTRGGEEHWKEKEFAGLIKKG